MLNVDRIGQSQMQPEPLRCTEYHVVGGDEAGFFEMSWHHCFEFL